MDDKRTSLEMIAPTIEEAIAKGLEELNLPEEAVDIDILDIGSQGLFGLGSRQARVRLTVKDPDATPEKGPQVAGIKTPVESQEAESDLPQEQDLTEEVAEIPDGDITQLEMGDQDIFGFDVRNLQSGR